MMIDANTTERDLSSEIGRKSTDDDFVGKEANSLSTSSSIGAVIDSNTGPLWTGSYGRFDIWTDSSLAAMSVLILKNLFATNLANFLHL